MKRVLQLFTLLWLPLLVCSATWAQTRIITGSVSDSKGQPIVGASVVVKGTTTGTYSDVDGKFTLAVPQDAKTLLVKFLGMKTQEVTLGTSGEIAVTLNEDILGLDEVVVTANAITREKRGLGYATTQVSGSELNAGDNSNMLSALEGKVAGVDIINMTGAPGSSQSIVIRGGSSLIGNNQALIVVDGIPIDNSNFRNGDDLNNQVDYGNRGNDINPDDIESISVLKGPAAAALYGSRASNGALIITTKKGHRSGTNSKIDVTVNSSLTFSSVLKLPTYQNTYGEGNVEAVEDDRRENFSWGLPFNGQERPWGQQIPINGVLSQQIKPYSAIPDNVLDFFNTGLESKNNVSFSGGSQKSSYYLSVGSLNSTGIIPTETYNKYNILFNASTELANHFTTSISLNYANINAVDPDAGQGNQSFYQQLLLTPRDIPLVDGKNLNSPFNMYNDVTGTYTYYAAYSINPYFSLDNYQNTNNVDRIFGNITTNYNPIKGLNITDRFGGDVYSDIRDESWKKYDYAPVDPFYLPFNQEYQGKYSQDILNLTSFNNDLMVSYERDLTKNFSGSILIGQNARQSTTTELFSSTNPQGGLSLPGYYNVANSNGPALTTNSLLETRNIGYYGDLRVDFRKMLFLELTGRNDFSSTLPAANNSYFYPSANLSWIFSELLPENIKKRAITYGKLYASYASVGNDAPPYVTANYYEVANVPGSFGSTQFPLNSIPGFTQSSLLTDPNLKPEFTTSAEVGTELGFLNDRIGIDLTFYEKKSDNQILALPLPASTGFLSQETNTGDVQNKGVEVGFRVTPIQTKSGFKWEVYGTYTKNENEVVSLANGVQQIDIGGFANLDIVAQVGKPYGDFYGVDLLKDPQGNVVVSSTNGLPETTPNLVYLGNFQPNYIASWGTSFSFKGFSLSVLFDTKQGGVFYSQTKTDMDFGGYATETVNRTPHVWPGSVIQNPDGSYSPNTTPYDPEVFFTTTSQFEAGTQMVDASYVKLREARLSYKLPDKWLKKVPFGSVTVSVFGNNLFLWTPKSNQYVDPELNSSGSGNAQGFEFLALPSQRNYGINLKFTF